MLVCVAFLLLLLGVPIGMALCSGLISIAFLYGSINLKFIAQAMFTGQESLPILAVPCFILAGSIMETGGLSVRLINVARKLTEHTSGGLGTVTILSCLFFGAISGSSPATTAAIGSIMIPYMVKAGYDRTYSTGLTSVAGSLGIIIPPSIPFVIYASVTSASVGKLFIAGIIPGFLVALVLMAVHIYIAKLKGYVDKKPKCSTKELFQAIWEGKWALLMPIIILGGIYSGVFTPTEASVIAIAYGMIIGLFVYKELKLRDICNIFQKTASFVGGFMLAYAPACALGSTLILLGLTNKISAALLGVTDNVYVILTLVVVFLIIMGMFLDTVSCLVVFGPILYAVLLPMGIDVIHLGVIMIICLAVGFVTPPVCMNIFIASNMTKIPVEAIAKKALPFIIALGFVCLLIAYFPQISLLFVR